MTEPAPSAPPATISLPGWDSIVSIPRGPQPSRDQIKEYYRAQRQGRRPDLPQDVVDEIKRRRDIRERIQSSATPATAQHWTRVMTWLDDAQDLGSVAAFAGRVFYRALPKIAGRLLPVLGWVLLAGDILKLLTLAASIIQPFFVGLCHGLRTGLIGALPPLVMGNAAKLIGHSITGMNPFSRRARLARARRFGGRLFRAGELLELAQASKTLTGYGLTLGGIMGTITESAYAIELAIRGKPVEIAVPGGTRISLTGESTLAPGSPTGLIALYEAIARNTADPNVAAGIRANADALRHVPY